MNQKEAQDYFFEGKINLLEAYLNFLINFNYTVNLSHEPEACEKSYRAFKSNFF